MRQSESKLILNEEGSGLILALMTLMVLAVLGASLGAITIGSHRLGAINRDDTSAYYIAEAGVNQAFEEIESEIRHIYKNSSHSDASSFFNAVENNAVIKAYLEGEIIEEFTPQAGSFPQALVSLNQGQIEGNSKTYTIKSSGNVDNKNRMAEKEFVLTWTKEETSKTLPGLPENASLIVRNEIIFDNGNINGDIYLLSSGSESFKISNSGTVSSNTSNIYLKNLSNNIFSAIRGNPDIESFQNRTRLDEETREWDSYIQAINGISVPSSDQLFSLEDKQVFDGSNSHDVHINNSLLVNSWIVSNFDKELTQDLFIDNIEITGNRVLNLIANDGTYNVVVNNLNIPQGSINILGNGQVNLFVLNEVNFGGGSTINKNGSISQLNFYYFGSSPFELSGNQSINGSLFNDVASISLGGSGSVTGSIVSRAASSITIQGGFRNNVLIYAPNADFNFLNGRISGVVLANSFRITGGATLEYKDFELFNFPFLSNTSNSGYQETTAENLIQSGPVIEPK